MNRYCLEIFLLFFSASAIENAQAFSANKGGFPKFSNPFAEPDVELSMEEKGKLLLESLDLESSTQPKVFYAEPKRSVDLATAYMPFIFRLGSGSFAEGHKVGFEDQDDSKYSILRLGNSKQIVETCAIDSPPILKRGPIVLYEFEGCPFCRKVREAVSMLSLEVEFRPCPQGSSFRREIKEEYGSSSTFPFMRDPNTGVEMFESDDIIRYLYRTYGVGEPPASLQKGILNTLTAGFGLVFRVNRGNKRKNSDPPKVPLILWSCEGPSFTKLVKEELCELQIAHVQISCPRGSPQRQRLFEKTGRFQIPYLEDPNTGVSLFESSAIIEYLNAMYAVEEPFIKYM